MVRIHTHIRLSYGVVSDCADFLFNIQAARTCQQSVVSERLSLEPWMACRETVDPVSHNRLLLLQARPGPLTIDYQCTVDLAQHWQSPDWIEEVPVAELPASALPFFYPSRYCQSDALGPMVMDLFGALSKGYRRVQAVLGWELPVHRSDALSNDK